MVLAELMLHLHSRTVDDAVTNMAKDFLLLNREASHLRFYGWSELCATFGCTQAYESARAQAPEGFRLIRRPSAGGFVSHAEDWTYAFTIPQSHRLYRARPLAIYQSVHGSLKKALGAQGIGVELAGEDAAHVPGTCFVAPAPFDLLYEGGKVAGAALKRSREGVLVQGSVQLRGLDFDGGGLEGAFAGELAEVLGVGVRECGEPEWCEGLLGEAVERFGSVEWTRRR